MNSYADLWNFRKRFTKQVGAVSFMTYLLSSNQRYPQKFHISCKTGNVWTSDIKPNVATGSWLISLAIAETVPFRLTPNIQNFITPVGLEGPFTASMIAIGRALCEPSNEMHDYLAIYLKEELISNFQMNRKSLLTDENLKEYVNQNVDLLVKRTQAISCKIERDEGAKAEQICPLNQTIIDLMNEAMNPIKLASTEIGYFPQL